MLLLVWTVKGGKLSWDRESVIAWQFLCSGSFWRHPAGAVVPLCHLKPEALLQDTWGGGSFKMQDTWGGEASLTWEVIHPCRTVASAGEILVCYDHNTEPFFPPDTESTYVSWKESFILFRYPLLQLLGIYRGFVWKYVKHNCLDLLIILLLQSMWQKIFCLAAVLLLKNEV